MSRIEAQTQWREADGNTPKRRNLILEDENGPSIIFMKAGDFVERQLRTENGEHIDAYSDKELVAALEDQGLPVPVKLETIRRSVAAVNPKLHAYWQ